MGNWRHRPSRRRPPKSYYDPQLPYQEYANDGVPLWEKEFCYDVGAVPWHRVVDSKYFSYCQSQILKWDDSSGEEAFHNAKNRYWALINGLPCDIPQPNPDACIDEIDWNPYIDPELIRELEQEYCAPDEDESNYGGRKKKSRNMYSDPPESCSVNPTDGVNPWGTQNLVQSSLTVDMEGQEWGDQWNDGNLKETNCLKNKDDNPWEKACHEGDEVENGNTAWPVGGGDSWGWNPSSVEGRNNTWERNRCKADDGWDDTTNTGWGDNQQQPRKWNQGNGGQKDVGWRNNSSSKAWTRKRWDDEGEGTKESEYRKANGGWGTWNRDCRTTRHDGGGHQLKTGYRTSGFEGDDYRAGGNQHWRGGKSKKRVSFGYS
ncbi:hypothetical protein LINPERHAP2_LOCUS4540 [Linum perenne]